MRLIDTTILLVFLETMRQRQATAVAREMGLTQPAVSHALKRLRNLYGDPLFLRRAHGLEPTALAHELEPKVRRIVRLLSETLEGSEEFDPGSAATDLRIGAFDFELTGVIPELVAQLRKVSPNINVHAFPLQNRDALEALVQGQIDLALGYFDFPLNSDASFASEDLHSEHYVLAGRRDHPIFARSLTLETVAKARHLLISPYGPNRNLVDHALHLQGLKRNIQTVVPSLFAALSIIENSDLVVTLPSRIAANNAERFAIAHRPLPIEGGTFRIHAVRHIRDATNPLHIWLLEKLRSVVADQTAVATKNN
ncbi:LysR family transcriptional regulator [Pseudaestuariivita atlantica]|uniref:LysR family transcriptional regulator n=1 Tax=Pseudaestuariivita atlantica TaxID=1317121 RepID=UPI001F5FA510|nr:LysR family transcriptional regulator [Pseudaestuariivita atlantica]